MSSTIKGLDEVIKRLRAIEVDGQRMVKDEIEGAARDIEAQAKSLAPTTVGVNLKQGISHSIDQSGLAASITQNATPIGAYVEFGTGSYVVVHPEWKDLAWQFYKNGMGTLRPHPYLYPAYVQGRKRLLNQLEKGLIKLTK